ncbi:MAG: sulfatase-like hydrolase/transferase, partial [Planctomycetes bacterium]|nr:sulfatase-like hydrolase/transferase [Planctomycetota bacterium]
GRKGLKPIFDFIETAGDKPFFIWYAPFLPHTPHNPPARLLSKYKAEGKSIHVARYQAMCEWFDETCGELLGYLDKKKLSDDTLVVFVTDNGWIQKEKSRGSDARSKRSPFDGGTRTPVMLRWPGKLKAARHDTLVSSIDLAPTILAAAGLEAHPEMQGVNLLDVCAAGGKSARNKIFGEIFEHDVGKIDDPVPGLLYRWCISGQWKLILPHRGSQVISRKRKSTYRDPIWAAPQLFNLGADPHERSTLAAAEADRVKALGSDIESWWKVEKP